MCVFRESDEDVLDVFICKLSLYKRSDAYVIQKSTSLRQYQDIWLFDFIFDLVIFIQITFRLQVIWLSAHYV